MTHSRNKGKRGELEAAFLMSVLTGKTWTRTAQHCGKGKADIECADFPVHVECKRYAAGLTWVQRRAERSRLCLAGNLYYAKAEALGALMDQTETGDVSPRARGLERWMEQAVRDCEGKVPLLLCRQDNGIWLMAWRYEDDDRLQKAWRQGCAGCTGAACSVTDES
jgi:hypothetical protein